MSNVLRYRHNVMDINSFQAFFNVRGQVNRGNRDVYFVRMLGKTEDEEKKLIDFEGSITKNNVKYAYYRIDQLPKLETKDKVDYYATAYKKWHESNNRNVIIESTKDSEDHMNTLGVAIDTVVKVYLELGVRTESMERNFVIKLFSWYDAIMEKLGTRWDGQASIKILGYNVSKEQEYLFYYMLTLVGCDVILLQMSCDIDDNLIKYGFSHSHKIGSFSACALETYKRENDDKAAINHDMRVVIPERPRTSGGKKAYNGSDRTVKEPDDINNSHKSTASEDTENKTFEELAGLAASVVMISVHDITGEIVASGSGIMISRDGYILTNHHVIVGGYGYTVRIEDDEKIYATSEVIKYNSVLDLAIIRIQRTLNPLKIYNGKKLSRGQKVVAIGSPLGLFNSVSDGIISGFRNVNSVDMIQFTAPISHGSSGGAVLNISGQVIGISTAGIDSGQNINLAVGYEAIRLFVNGIV